MDFKNDELQMIKMLSLGYVFPITEYNEPIIQKLLKSSFLMDKKRVKLIKSHSIDLNDIFCATIDTRFDLETIAPRH